MAGIFEKIASGEIPSHRIYEDEHCVAFLDINPVSRGHALVIPRKCWERLDQVPTDVAAALGAALPKIAAAIMEVTGAPGYNVLQNNNKVAGQVVPHVHFHIIPRYGGGSEFHFNWPAGTLEKNEAVSLKEKVIAAMK